MSDFHIGFICGAVATFIPTMVGCLLAIRSVARSFADKKWDNYIEERLRK